MRAPTTLSGTRRSVLWLAALGVSALASLASTTLAPGCATLGGTAGEPEGLPHNGTGPFRDLDPDETNVRSPRGAALAIGGVTIDSAMVASDGSLFYAGAMAMARPMPDAGMPQDAGVPTDAGVVDDSGVVADAAVPTTPDAGPAPATFAAPDWSAHAARSISRSAPVAAMGLDHVTNSPSFAAGSAVLSASQPWEGGYVSDPWALIRADGSVLLYYAAEGGIGVATGASVSGPFTGSASPVIAAGASTPRRPSVIETRLLSGASHAFLMYYEDDGRILVAGSSDGLAWSAIGTVSLTPMPARDDRDGDEIEIGGPGAIVVTSPANRSFVRLYYESRRSNGNTLITLAAAPDGATFESFGRPVVEARDRRFPSAFEIDDRISFLYQWAPDGLGTSQGTVFVGVAPAGLRLAPEM